MPPSRPPRRSCARPSDTVTSRSISREWKHHPTETTEIIEEILMSVADLETAVANVQAAQAALATEVTTEIANFQAEIANLQAAIAAGDSAAIQASIDNLNTVATGLGASAAALTAADPGTQPAAEGIVDAPTAGTGNEDPSDPNSPTASATAPSEDPTSEPTTTESTTTAGDASSASDSASTSDETSADGSSTEPTA